MYPASFKSADDMPWRSTSVQGKALMHVSCIARQKLDAALLVCFLSGCQQTMRQQALILQTMLIKTGIKEGVPSTTVATPSEWQTGCKFGIK